MPDIGKKRSFEDGRGRQVRQPKHKKKYTAVCGKCGKNCVIPFKPIGVRPVLCDCCLKEKKTRFKHAK